MKYLKYAGILSALTIFSSAIVSADEFEKTIRHEFPNENVQVVNLESDRGDVKLSKSSSGRVEVVVSLTARTSSRERANAIFDSIRTEFLELDSGKVRAAVKSGKSGFDWIKFWKKHPQVSVELFVPDSIKLNVASGAGDIDGGGFSTDLRIATGAGDVDLGDLKGTLNIATGAGDVDLRGFEGSLKTATGAGDVQVSGTFTSFGISTGAGDVDISADNPFSDDSKINTGAGDIDIALSVGSSFELLADVGFGDISCDFDIVDTDPDEKSFRGSFNEGSSSLRLSTGLGDIFVRKQ